MKRTIVWTAASALLCLSACGEGPVTDHEEAAFLDVARDNVPGAANYSDDVLGGMASQVCSVLNGDTTTGTDALDVMDNYESLSIAEQATIVGLAVGSACPENQDKVD